MLIILIDKTYKEFFLCTSQCEDSQHDKEHHYPDLMDEEFTAHDSRLVQDRCGILNQTVSNIMLIPTQHIIWHYPIDYEAV